MGIENPKQMNKAGTVLQSTQIILILLVLQNAQRNRSFPLTYGRSRKFTIQD